MSATDSADTAVDTDGDGAPDGNDCAPTDPAVFPAAPEVCDGIDDDCDGLVDAADDNLSDGTLYYEDLDADGYGSTTSVAACAPAAGLATVDTDCDDTDPAVQPGATEVCDDIDDDCDGLVDAADPDLVQFPVWYTDADADGYGDPESGVAGCDPPAGDISDGNDCDDTDPGIHPDAEESCNTVDDDCNGTVDDAAEACPAPAAPPAAGRVLWLSADSGVSTSGTTLTDWADEGTATSVVSRVVGRPELSSETFPTGDHDVIAFDGASGIALVDDGTLDLTTLSVFVVAGIDSGAQMQIFIADYTDIVGWCVGISDATAEQSKWFTAPHRTRDDEDDAGNDLVPGTPYLLTTWVDPSLSADNKSETADDGAVATTLTTTDSTSTITYPGASPSIGYLSSNGGELLEGWIAEILVYDTADPANTAVVQDYLRTRYLVP